jgi:hypothetical protein
VPVTHILLIKLFKLKTYNVYTIKLLGQPALSVL